MKNRALLIASIALSFTGLMCATAYGQSKPKITKVKPAPEKKKDDTKESAEPDKVLYDRAMLSVKKARYTEARLDFQTLINTYPDSEYLAKAAEDEFRAFLLKYPQSSYVPQAEQSLRNVQEILADGEFGIAKFYYVKKDYRASAARLVEVTGRYPLYSGSDEALWMLGDVYQRARQAVKNEDEKNHWADLAAKCYSRIVQDYPSSTLGGSAKERLKSMNLPVPAPNP